MKLSRNHTEAYLKELLWTRRSDGRPSYQILKKSYSMAYADQIIHDWDLFDDYEKAYNQIIEIDPAGIICIDLGYGSSHPYKMPRQINLEGMKNLWMGTSGDLPITVYLKEEAEIMQESYDPPYTFEPRRGSEKFNMSPIDVRQK